MIDYIYHIMIYVYLLFLSLSLSTHTNTHFNTIVVGSCQGRKEGRKEGRKGRLGTPPPSQSSKPKHKLYPRLVSSRLVSFASYPAPSFTTIPCISYEESRQWRLVSDLWFDVEILDQGNQRLDRKSSSWLPIIVCGYSIEFYQVKA
mgnify:CR=1 FL=1